MKVFIIGSGGREHALLRQVLESPKVSDVFCAPGNAGMSREATCVPISVESIDELVAFAKKEEIDLTIIGPELPLTLGIVDAFQNQGLAVFGPTQRASILEGSKIFTKEFCERHAIPTASFSVFEEADMAKEYVQDLNTFPIVVKADGLAAGKGVIIAQNQAEADLAIEDILSGKYGSKDQKLLIEDFVTGLEVSFIAACHGEDFVTFLPSQDHKRVGDGDKGPNTGGMGAYAPAPLLTDDLREKVIERIIKPTLRGMIAEDRPYTGFLYAGLMITESGEPSLLEYNCRLGDPEAQVILPLIKSDFVELLRSTLSGELSDYKVEYRSGSAVCVVLASGGYPGSYNKGEEISGLDQIDDQNVWVIHAGTKLNDGQFLTNGGRVLAVVAQDNNLKAAIDKVYASVPKITWPGVHYRKDIGAKAL